MRAHQQRPVHPKTKAKAKAVTSTNVWDDYEWEEAEDELLGEYMGSRFKRPTAIRLLRWSILP